MQCLNMQTKDAMSARDVQFLCICVKSSTAAAAAKSLQSCLTVRPHRQQPTRLPCPWDSPGKNNGVGCHFLLQCMKVRSESEGVQSCPTLSDPIDCSPPGSSIHGIFQARVLEWGAIAFSKNHLCMGINKYPQFHHIKSVCLYVCVCVCSVMYNSVTLWTAARQTPLSMGFSRQDYWRGLPCPPPGDLPNPGIKAPSLASPALAS